MATSGPLYPGTGATATGVGTIAWTNPGNITLDDGSFATFNDSSTGSSGITSNYLKGTNYGFSIPSGATINGIFVEVKYKASSSDPSNVDYAGDNVVSIIKSNGSIGTTNKKRSYPNTANQWPTTSAYTSYGNSSDLWGETWAFSDINNSNFGVAISGNIVDGDNLTITGSVDTIRITVTYTPLIINTSKSFFGVM